MMKRLDKVLKDISSKISSPNPSSLIHNRFVLYAVFFLAIGNLFVATINGDNMFVIYFVLIGFLISFFNKNMAVILVLTLVFSNLLKSTSKYTHFEGMETKSDDDKEVAKTKSGDKADDSKKKPTESKKPKTKTELVDDLEKKAHLLIEQQKEILGGFQKIDPYMKQAEELIQDIDSTAKKIEEFNSSVAK
jgi:hypothetical protein